MQPTYGPLTCKLCGLTKANTAAMRKHTLAAHRELGRNANRRLPPRQQAPSPALVTAAAAGVAPSRSGGSSCDATSASLCGQQTALRQHPLAAGSSSSVPPAGDALPLVEPGKDVLPFIAALETAATVADRSTDDGVVGLPEECGDDDATLLLNLSQAAEVQASREENLHPVVGGKPPLGGQQAFTSGHAHHFSSVATEAQAEYERIGNAKRCEPAIDARQNCKPGQFNTPALKMLQTFVNECNGSGLSTASQTRLYELLARWDGSDGSGSADAGGPSRIADVFTSPTAFRNAVRDDLDDAILSAGWKKCTLVQGGVSYVTFFRSALKTALDALRNAKEVQLRRDDGDVGDRREAPMDGEALRAHQEAVDDTTAEKAFVLGLYVYSDASLLSWSGGTFLMLLVDPCMSSLCLFLGRAHFCADARVVLLPHTCLTLTAALSLGFVFVNPILYFFVAAHYLYPIRIRVVNDVSGEVRCFTVAYVPIVRTLKEPGGKVKATGRCWGVLQRTLYIAFREAIASSHSGQSLETSIGGYTLAFLRVLLYTCDRPEERAVLCMKASNFGKCCSSCEVQAKDACSEEGVTTAPRDVVETLTRHLEAAKLRRTTRARKRRVLLETESSINSFVPALASLGGLRTFPHHLYKMIAIDPLHVCSVSLLS